MQYFDYFFIYLIIKMINFINIILNKNVNKILIKNDKIFQLFITRIFKKF